MIVLPSVLIVEAFEYQLQLLPHCSNGLICSGALRYLPFVIFCQLCVGMCACVSSAPDSCIAIDYFRQLAAEHWPYIFCKTCVYSIDQNLESRFVG